MSLTSSVTRLSQVARRLPVSNIRPLSAPAAAPADKEKRYVRIAGPSCYASKQDIAIFLKDHDIALPGGLKSLVQGQSDVYQNHSIWLMEADSQPEAFDVASRISGRVLGMKLVRAVAVDQKLYDGLLAVPQQADRSTSLRKRMNIISPQKDERGRALLARNLHNQLSSRVLWSFFSAYDVVDVRHLRKSGVACIVFASEAEAERALRERKNLPLQQQQSIGLKIHD